MKNVGNDNPLLSSPQVGGGDPSETNPDGFPINNVGNNGMDSPFPGSIENRKLEVRINLPTKGGRPGSHRGLRSQRNQLHGLLLEYGVAVPSMRSRRIR